MLSSSSSSKKRRLTGTAAGSVRRQSSSAAAALLYNGSNDNKNEYTVAAKERGLLTLSDDLRRTPNQPYYTSSSFTEVDQWDDFKSGKGADSIENEMATFNLRRSARLWERG